MIERCLGEGRRKRSVVSAVLSVPVPWIFSKVTVGV